jgi:putative transposase
LHVIQRGNNKFRCLADERVLMKNLGQRYVPFVNRHRCRSGTLWEGRFRSCIVDSERYLLTCHRYIELNPVRAGMAARPDEYPWSSHRCNAHGLLDAMITPHATFIDLGVDSAARLSAYRRMGWEPMGSTELARIRSATNSGFVLGDTGFIERVERELGRPAAARKRGPRKGSREAHAELFLPAE